MATFKFLHAADLHLDSPLRGLEGDADAPAERIRRATRDALVNLVNLALEEQVALVLLAGDLYDGDWPDWRTGQFLLRQVERLTRANIPVIAIRGNHDAESVMSRRLTWPDGAKLLRADRAETIILPALETAVHGRSFATREVLENLVLSYPPPQAGLVNIGILHTAAEGRAGHRSYAPCELQQLVHFGYDYWALGHVHTREILAREPWVVFPGNLQGRDIGETGDKGATLVTVEHNRITAAEHRSLDVVRWIKLEIDVSGAADEDAALATAREIFAQTLQSAEGKLLAARVTLRGACPAHSALCRSLSDTREKLKGEALSCGGSDRLWLEHVVLETTPVLDQAALRERPDLVGLLVREIENINPADLAPSLQGWAKPLLDRAALLRAALGDRHPAVQVADGTLSAEMLDRARQMLLARLAET